MEGVASVLLLEGKCLNCCSLYWYDPIVRYVGLNVTWMQCSITVGDFWWDLLWRPDKKHTWQMSKLRHFRQRYLPIKMKVRLISLLMGNAEKVIFRWRMSTLKQTNTKCLNYKVSIKFFQTLGMVNDSDVFNQINLLFIVFW